MITSISTSIASVLHCAAITIYTGLLDAYQRGTTCCHAFTTTFTTIFTTTVTTMYCRNQCVFEAVIDD